MPARQDFSEWDSDSESRLAGRPSAVGKAGETKTPLSDRRELPRFSIVVLPFVNIGGDSEQGYFADGVTDSLTTDLSRIRGAFVIGSRTSFTYKGKAADVRRSAATSTCATRSKAACSGAQIACASTSSLSTPRRVIISGQSASKSPLPTSLTCRTRLYRALRGR
jgi:hypothetical protein